MALETWFDVVWGLGMQILEFRQKLLFWGELG